MEYFLLNESVKTLKYNNSRFKEIKKLYQFKDLQLISAKNDWIAFQIIITDIDDFCVSIDDMPYFSIEGNCDIYRVKTSSNDIFEVKQQLVDYIDDDSGIRYADILLNNTNKHFEKNEVCTIWVEIQVPKDTIPSDYTFDIEIYRRKRFDNEELIHKKTIGFKVYNFICKDPKENSFYLDLWQHNCNIARKSEVELWSDKHFKIIEEYVKTLAAIGQKAISIIVSDAPWSSQFSYNFREYLSDLFEYSCIKTYKNAVGEIYCDFTDLERLIKIYTDNSIHEEISIFGLLNIWANEEDGYGSVCKDYPDAIRIRCFNTHTREYFYLYQKKDIETYIKALYDYFVKKNLIDKVRIICDEPSDFELYLKRIEILKRNAPLFKYKVAVYKPEYFENIDENVTDIVSILPLYANNFDMLQNIQINNPQKRFLYYLCCWPKFPNTFIESPLIESRLIPYISFKLNNSGFLRWNYTVWPDKPRERLSFNAPNWVSGDTCFVYPSNSGYPLLSLRYKNLKRGIQEFEILKSATIEKQNEVMSIIFKENDFSNYYVSVK